MTALRAWWRRATGADYGRHAARDGQPTPTRPVRGTALLRRAG